MFKPNITKERLFKVFFFFVKKEETIIHFIYGFAPNFVFALRVDAKV